MSRKIEVLSVTADEAIRLLGSLSIEEIEKILDDIKTFREEKLFSSVPILVSTTQETIDKRTTEHTMK